jgi:hypothetical protein
MLKYLFTERNDKCFQAAFTESRAFTRSGTPQRGKQTLEEKLLMAMF